MPSPPLAPDDGPIDLDHLARMTLGDAGLEQEVLAMFSAQSAKLLGELASLPAEALAIAHTLKGSARATIVPARASSTASSNAKRRTAFPLLVDCCAVYTNQRGMVAGF